MAWIWLTRAATASALMPPPQCGGPRSSGCGPRGAGFRGRSSGDALAHVHADGDLVELDAFAALQLGLVLGAPALLEALEDLALAAGVAQRAAAGGGRPPVAAASG